MTLLLPLATLLVGCFEQRPQVLDVVVDNDLSARVQGDATIECRNGDEVILRESSPFDVPGRPVATVYVAPPELGRSCVGTLTISVVLLNGLNSTRTWDSWQSQGNFYVITIQADRIALAHHRVTS
jgi:hypothetical protein